MGLQYCDEEEILTTINEQETYRDLDLFAHQSNIVLWIIGNTPVVTYIVKVWYFSKICQPSRKSNRLSSSPQANKQAISISHLKMNNPAKCNWIAGLQGLPMIGTGIVPNRPG